MAKVRSRAIVKNFLLGATSLIVSLALAEGVARVFHEPRSLEMTDFRLTRSAQFQRDDSLGWIPLPNVQGRHDKPGSFESTFSTSAQGLRDRDHPFERQPGVSRVLVLGDSFAWGYGVNDGEMFPAVMESELQNTEVINLGITGYGLSQEIGILQRIGWRFDPDAVVLAFVMNDVTWTWDPARASEREAAAAEPIAEPAPGLFLRVKRGLAQHSALYALFQDVTNQSKAMVDLLVAIGLKEPPPGLSALDQNLVPALDPYPESVEAAWRDREQELLALKRLCDERGVRLIIAIVPALQMIRQDAFRETLAYTSFYPDDFDLDKPVRRLRAFGAAHDIAIVDPTPAFQEANDAGADLYLRRDMHFTPSGHQLFAREIAAFLSR